MWGLMFRLLAGASAAYLFISGIPYFIKLYDALKAYMAYRKLTRELEKSGCEPSLNPVQPSSSSLRHRHTTIQDNELSNIYLLEEDKREVLVNTLMQELSRISRRNKTNRTIEKKEVEAKLDAFFDTDLDINPEDLFNAFLKEFFQPDPLPFPLD